MIRRIAARWYAFVHCWDTGDLAQAAAHGQWISEHVDDYPDVFRQSLAVELALFAALENADLDSCGSWMKRSRGGVVDEARRALAEAAHARLEGRTEDAKVSLSRAERKLSRAMDSGLATFTADQIQHLRARLNEAPPKLPPSSDVTFPATAR